MAKFVDFDADALKKIGLILLAPDELRAGAKVYRCVSEDIKVGEDDKGYGIYRSDTRNPLMHPESMTINTVDIAKQTVNFTIRDQTITVKYRFVNTKTNKLGVTSPITGAEPFLLYKEDPEKIYDPATNTHITRLQQIDAEKARRESEFKAYFAGGARRRNRRATKRARRNRRYSRRN